MPNIIFNYGYWEFWANYDPPNGYYGSHKVAFDGLTRTILVAQGVTELNVKEDLYSAWKHWVQVPDRNNAAWVEAMSAVGGDPVTDVQSLGTTFFLENDWKIQPAPGQYLLSIVGNLYTREIGGAPVNPEQGVSVSFVRSNIVDGFSGISESEYQEIANRVWDELRVNHTIEGSFGEGVASVQGDISGSISGDLLGSGGGGGESASAIALEVWNTEINETDYPLSGTAGNILNNINSYGDYEHASVWLNTVSGTSGTISGKNGTYKFPSLTLSDAITIANNNNLQNIEVMNNSIINLASIDPASISGYRFHGHKWLVGLGDIDTANLIFEGAEITGTANNTNKTLYKDCILSGSKFGASEIENSILTGTLNFSSTGLYVFSDCFSGVAGTSSPVIDFESVGDIQLNMRHYSGGIEFKNMSSSDNITVEGNGQIILDSTCAGGILAVRGHFEITDNSGNVTISDNARFDRERISVSVWDEPLKGSTHNLPTSAGRRLRQLSDSIILTEDSAISGTINSITLANSASDIDNEYDPAIIYITEGTGAGQSRLILQYFGPTRKAIVDRNWKVIPDNTSTYIVGGEIGREHVNEGLAQGGTTNTITLNSLASSVDDSYVNQVVFIRSGLGDDQVGLIIAYDGTTKVATIEKDWGIIPDDTSAYVMLPYHIHTNTETASLLLDENLAIHNTAGTVGEALNKVKNVSVGRWKIDVNTNKMIMYAEDNVTIVAEFDLKDQNGDPSATTVFERVPV